MPIILGVVALLIAGFMTKYQILWPLAFAVTMFVIKFLKMYYCKHCAAKYKGKGSNNESSDHESE